jgi:hypothetical protein
MAGETSSLVAGTTPWLVVDDSSSLGFIVVRQGSFCYSSRDLRKQSGNESFGTHSYRTVHNRDGPTLPQHLLMIHSRARTNSFTDVPVVCDWPSRHKLLVQKRIAKQHSNMKELTPLLDSSKFQYPCGFGGPLPVPGTRYVTCLYVLHRPQNRVEDHKPELVML